MKELDRVRKLGFLFLDVLEPQQRALLDFLEGTLFEGASAPCPPHADCRELEIDLVP